MSEISVSITADVSKLQVARAILSAEMKAATKSLNDFVKEAAATGPTDALREGMLASAEAAEAARQKIAGITSQLKEMRAVAAPAVAETEHGFAALSASISESGVRLRETVGMVGEMREAMMAFGELMLAAFAVEAIHHFAERLGEAAEKTKHISEQLGLTIAETQGLQAAAAGVGVPFDNIVKGMGLLDKKFETTPKLFRELGIILPQNASQMQILAATMDRFQGLEDGPKKAALALTLMGKAGKDLIPFMNEGSKGLEELFAKAEKYGAVSQDASTKGIALAEAINEGKIASMGLSNTMTRAFGPVLQSAVEGFSHMVAAITKSYNEGGAAKVIFDGIAGTFQLLGSAIVVLAPVFDALGTTIKFVSDNIAIILPVAGAVATLFAGPMVAAFVASTVATIAQSTAMGALVAGFISEGLIGGVAAAYGLLTGGIGAATIATWEFTAALLVNPLVLLATAAAAAVGGLVYLAMHVKSTRDAFEFLWDGVKIVGAYIVGEIDVLKVTLLAFAKLAWDAFHLNWSAVQADWQAGLQGVENSVRTTANNIKKLMDDAKSHLAYSGSDDKYDPHALDEIMHKVKPPADVNLEHQAKPKKAKAAPKEKDTIVSDLDAELEAKKTAWAKAQDAQGTYQQWALQSDADFWNQALKRTDLSTKDRTAIERKYLAARMALLQEKQAAENQDAKQSAALAIESARLTGELAKMELQDKIGAITAAHSAGKISATEEIREKAVVNQQLLDLDLIQSSALNNIRLKELQAERAILGEKPGYYKKIGDQITLLAQQQADAEILIARRKGQAERTAAQQLAAQQRGIWNQAFQGFSQNISKMITMQQGFAATFKGIWQGIQNMFAQAINNMLRNFLVGLVTQEVAQTLSNQRTILQDAKTAASNAYSWAAAWGGPPAGAVAAAIAFTAVEAYSAEGGDANVTPGLYQLHAREMVLPEWAATPLRQSLLGGGVPSFGAPANDRGGHTFNGPVIMGDVQAMDGHSFKKFAMDNKHTLAGATHAAVQQGFRPRNGR